MSENALHPPHPCGTDSTRRADLPRIRPLDTGQTPARGNYFGIVAAQNTFLEIATRKANKAGGWAFPRPPVRVCLGMAQVHVRTAVEADIPFILAMIKELAAYEKEPDAVFSARGIAAAESLGCGSGEDRWRKH